MKNNPGITDIGRNALTKVVFDRTSLNSMSDCNHVCIIHVDGGINVPTGSSNGNRYLPSSNARRVSKIYQLLSERNKEGSNVQHLNLEFDDGDEENDNSLKLAPHVLECVQMGGFVSSDSVKPLSIMYEVLRGWKMPELYEKRS